MRVRIVMLLCSLLCSVAVTPTSAAQNLSDLAPGDSSGSASVEREDILQRAIDAFVRGAEARLTPPADSSAATGSPTLEERRQRVRLSDRVAELRRRMTTELLALERDGVLDRSEASSALGELAGDAWTSFEEAADAIERGYALPPWHADFASGRSYAWALAKYTLLERNRPLMWGSVAAIIAVGVLGAWLASYLLGTVRKRLRDDERKALGELTAALRGPVYVTFIIAALAVAMRVLWVPLAAEEPAWVLVKLAMTGALLWLVWRVVDLVAQGAGWLLTKTYEEPNRQTIEIIRKSLQLLTLTAVIVVSAEILLGINLESWILGAGLVGIAFTLAAQDTLKNFFGSVTLVVDKPYRVGDLIDFKGFLGRVEDIGFRSTKVREFDGHLVTIPNAEVVREAVQNIDARPWIRRRFRIGLRYDTTPAKVKEAIEILESILIDRDDAPEEMKSHIVFEGFGESTLNLLVQYCVEPGNYWDALDRGTELNLKILEQFHEAKIAFAFPTRTTVLESDGMPDAVAVRFGKLDESLSASDHREPQPEE